MQDVYETSPIKKIQIYSSRSPIKEIQIDSSRSSNCKQEKGNGWVTHCEQWHHKRPS